ncbi:MAG TPA: DUF5668 domain-containing protein [Holophagaceae bacterium]
MNPEPRRSLFTPKLVLGLGLIFLGLVLALDQLGWPRAWHALHYWPLLPAALGLAKLRQRGWAHLGGHAWLGLAIVGLASEFGRENLLDRWWPLFVVWAGLVVALRALRPPQPKSPKSCDPGPTPTSVNHDSLS